MNPILNTQELAITLAAKHLNPAALNLDFLRYSGIVPADWELARPAVYTNQLVQLVFKQGVSVVAQPNRIIFAEVLAGKESNALQIPKIAQRCVQKLPNVDYQAVGINPKGIAAFEDESVDSYQYLTQSLLAKGAWQSFGTAPVKASLQLAYTLEKGQLSLTINEATLRLSEQQQVPAVLFAGNFNYSLQGESEEGRLKTLQAQIRSWASDLKVFEDLINENFLQGQSALFGNEPTTS